jgi:GT2 family glycosyltransferase
MSSWIVIPVHNRRATTRACLARLQELGLFDKTTVCLVDDACTDGTREMVEREFPAVRIVDGNGNLFWGGGILEGMIFAHGQGAETMVWLNDDCLPLPGAVETVIARVLDTRGICGGICHDPAHPEVLTYSGTKRGSDAMVCPGRDEIESVELINGNLVAVHRDVVARIGFPPGRELPHYGGDSVYSLRATRAGIPCEVHGNARATNPPNPYFDRFGSAKPAWLLLKEPFRVGSILFWPTYWRFLCEAYGWRAYVRWPAYFLRLAKQLGIALRRQRVKPSSSRS